VSDLLRNIVRFILFIAVQVFILNTLHLHQYVIPYLYYLFILWLPFSISRQALLFIGFFTGLTLDYFSMQIGVHTAACTLIAYARPFIINLLTPKDSSEFNYREPSPKAMQWMPYMVYVLLLTILHHTYMTFLQWLQFGKFTDFLIKVISTTAISMLLVFTVELLFPRKLKFRTNV
jgi:hypothetical protein